MDILTIVYDKLLENSTIQEQAGGQIKYYEYPEVNEVDSPKIIIEPLDSSLPADYADDNWMTYDFLLQIEVWSINRMQTESLASHIRDQMWKLGFYQQAGTKEYDEGIFRDARRYRGKLYRESIN